MTPSRWREPGFALLLLVGTGPAALSWPWARVMITLWTLLWAFSWIPEQSWKYPLIGMLFFLTSAATFWSLAMRLLPHWPPPVIFGLGLIAVIFLVGSRLIQPLLNLLYPKKVSNVGSWPTRSWVLGFLLLFVGGFMLIHRLLSGRIGPAFHWEDWSSVLWAAVSILVYYPTLSNPPFQSDWLKFSRYVCPWMIVGILLIHSIRYRALENELNSSPNPGRLLEKIYTAGYQKLGIRTALLETFRIQAAQGWPTAVQFLRGQWRYADKVHFARAWRSDPIQSRDLFLFSTVFGCTLRLQPGEETVDIGLDAANSEYQILTSQGRLLAIGSDGLHCLQQDIPEPLALSISTQSGNTGILTKRNQVWIKDEEGEITRFDLPSGRNWKDIQFSADSRTIWLLESHGAVEMFQESLPDSTWGCSTTVSPHLWEKDELAQALVVLPNGKQFLILDACGGVYLRGEDSRENFSLSRKDLIHYYNPEEKIMRDLAFWNEDSVLAILNHYGRIDFITPGLDQPNQEKPYKSIRADFFYHPTQGTWIYKPDIAAFVALPEAGTFIQLLRSGMLQAIAMPPGVRILFKDQSALVSTDVPLTLKRHKAEDRYSSSHYVRDK